MKTISLLKSIIFFAFLAMITFGCGNKKSSTEISTTDSTEVEEKQVNINGKEVTYNTEETAMIGYLAYDENQEGKRPGIIVVHEWWGHNDYVRERADMLAEMGYTALAVDMYGDGKQAAHPDDAGKFSGMVMSNIDEAQARFEAALKILQSHETVDTSSLAAIGYCFGGSVALTMANSGMPLDVVAAFHSGVQLPIMPGENLKAKVLVCNGADDPFVSAESVSAFTEALEKVNADYKYIAYEGAVHAFTSKGADSLGAKFELPLAYNQEADEKSWEELQKLLSDTF